MVKPSTRLAAMLAFLSASAAVAQVLPPPPPAPPVVPVTEDLFGTRVTDNYRYMEEPNNPVFRDWIRAEGRYARGVFDAMPGRAALGQRVAALTGSFGLANQYQAHNEREFWMSREPGSDQYDLMVRDSRGARKLIDLAAIRAANNGRPMAINYYAASPDGSRVAIGLSEGGSENASLSVYDAATGQRIAGPLDRAQFGPPIWSEDGRHLYINRLAVPGPDARPTDRYLNNKATVWDLSGEPVTLIGQGGSPLLQPEPHQFVLAGPAPGTSLAVAMVLNGVEPEMELWTARADAPITAATAWRPLTTRSDQVINFAVRGEHIYLLSNKDAPTGQLLVVRAGEPMASARVVVPAQPGRLIESVAPAADGIYVVAREGLYSRLYRLADGAGEPEEITLPGRGSIDATTLFAHPRRPGITLLFDSWTRPPSTFSYDPAERRFVDRGLGSVPASFRADAYAVSDLEAPARDGTRVPFSLMRRADATGPQPLLILAYGSYGISQFPYFSSRNAAILNEGISFGVCHVRGGGELGEEWRRGGRGAEKPNTWRDLIACAEEAVRQGLTTPEQLFIMGGSAGGIPMGMAPVERPELFAGVISAVPMASALRAEFQTNGPANIPEFGTIEDEQGFRNLLAMDGYQAVRDGMRLPPYLITTGLNDPRVDSWQPGKYAARLRAANADNLVLLRVDEEAGHGIGSTRSQGDELNADMIAFINWRLGREGFRLAD